MAYYYLKLIHQEEPMEELIPALTRFSLFGKMVGQSPWALFRYLKKWNSKLFFQITWRKAPSSYSKGILFYFH